MKITALVENTTNNDKLEAKHGLSLYIETVKQKILVDVGSDDLFLKNARELGIDIQAVEKVIITHGHSDHGGGLEQFLEINKTAKVYIQESAFKPYYSKALGLLKIKIGLDERLKSHPQIVLINGDTRIDDEILLITNPDGRKLMPRFNSSLLEKKGRSYIQDEFTHEQSLLISENKIVLIGGCAHRGIINIIEDAEKKTEKPVDVCISGFHLFNPASKATENSEIIEKLADGLKTKNIKYYTCHCTGTKAYQIMKEKIPDALEYLACGETMAL